MKDFKTFKTRNETINEQELFGMMQPIMPQRLPSDVENLLNERLGDEYTAYFFYRNAANWCKNVNYPKAAAFFEAEASGELGHAQGIQDYLSKWNCYPMIPQVPTIINFSSLVDVINKAYEIEYALLGKYEGDQQMLLTTHPATFNFIQGYVDIQVGEVSEYSDYLNALQLINTNSRLDIMFFEDKYFG